MPEYLLSSLHTPPVVRLDDISIKRDLFFLLTISMVNEAIAKRSDIDGERKEILEYFIAEFNQDECLLRLISSAALLRARDDYISQQLIHADTIYQSEIQILRSKTCGVLQENKISENEIGLTFREACNKILHATHINFDLEQYAGDVWITTIIYLYGNNGKTKWKASIDIISFVELAVRMLNHNALPYGSLF